MDKERQLKPALCLDLDGTVRRSKSGATFIKNAEDMELLPGVEEKILAYKKKGWLILGFSNQAGVAHGFKTSDQITVEMNATHTLFKDPKMFHNIYWCEYDGKGTVEPFNHRSLFRKPDIGMLAHAELHYAEKNIMIDWDKSLFVGDRPEDEQCAHNAQIRFKHIDNFLKDNAFDDILKYAK